VEAGGRFRQATRGTGLDSVSTTRAPRSPLPLGAGATPSSARSVSSACPAATRWPGLVVCYPVTRTDLGAGGSPAAPRNTLNGVVARYANCGQDAPRSRPVRACPGTRCPDGPPTIDAMPLEIHTQSDPDRFCETCGGSIRTCLADHHPWTATRRWRVKCRRGHHGVQTRGARAADHGIRR